MAKKKAAKKATAKKLPAGKAGRGGGMKRKAAPKAAKKSVKKATRKAPRAPKKAAPRAARGGMTSKAPKAPTRPKRPRRTKQALPPEAPPPTPVVDVEPLDAETDLDRGAEAEELAQEGAGGPLGEVEDEAFEEEGLDEDEDEGIGPGAGDSAPDFELPDETGRVHALSQYRGRTVVLYFYPKDDTPGCTVEACGFRDYQAAFTEANAVVLGVSPDPVESHARFARKYGLNFPILADVGHKVAERYGVWREKQRYGRSYFGVVRTTFVIDPDGRIARVFHDVHAEGHERAVLETLETARQ